MHTHYFILPSQQEAHAWQVMHACCRFGDITHKALAALELVTSTPPSVVASKHVNRICILFESPLRGSCQPSRICRLLRRRVSIPWLDVGGTTAKAGCCWGPRFHITGSSTLQGCSSESTTPGNPPCHPLPLQGSSRFLSDRLCKITT